MGLEGHEIKVILSDMKILLIGYGNPGRLDDGLGPALAERIQGGGETGRSGAIVVESNYQLNVEDAAQIAEYDMVVFADASTDAEPPFTFTPVMPEPGGLSFSSHSVSASQLMGMVDQVPPRRTWTGSRRTTWECWPR